MKKVNAILTFVLREAHSDCTNGGVTSKYDSLYLIGDGIDDSCITIDLDDKETAARVVVLERRKLFGKEYLSAYPLEKETNGKWYMSGGNFITTSDSRFPSDYPIPVHDRTED